MGGVQEKKVWGRSQQLITDIRLQDFISHRDTHLEFGKGITVFVGHNGSGKSSVIDAITFSLFGKHSRQSGKNLVRRGATEGSVQMRFAMNSKEYQATRILGASGSQSFSQLMLLSDAGKMVSRPLAGGERRQLGESMSAEVAKILGVDYDKMRVAAVVQQGELGSIVDAQPREFKELLNGLIGIDRLDAAYQTMREVVAAFRERLRDDTGYTDEEIPRIEKLIEEKGQEQRQAESLLSEFEEEKSRLEQSIARLESEIARLEPIIQKTQELRSRERLLVRHVNETRGAMESEVARLERVVREAKGSLEVLKDRDEVRVRLEMVRTELEDIQEKMEENEGMHGKLRGFLECADRLQIVDGRCPVCNSPVTEIKGMFNTSHIQAEIESREEQRYALQRSRVELKMEQEQLLEQDRRIAAAEKFLSNNSVNSPEEVLTLQSNLDTKQADLARLPREIALVDAEPLMLAIDGTSKSLAEEIIALRRQVNDFSHQVYTDAKLEKDNQSRKLQEVNRRIGGYLKTIDDAKNAIDSARKSIAQLRDASVVAGILDRIRSNIFNRDGPIGTSLRSWAIKVISEKASDYASLFNIGISRIELAEKTREVTITCFGRQGEIDLDSLSGGEKVAVALALRLGIAYMMGSNKLDFVILDEPTTHLDEERRKALVRIVSEAFREGAGPLSQLIIITHDSDIFEDAEVDRIFRFAMTAEGSRVSQE
ncbi:MAG: AAA family ATPase [Nitrososphaera sp.]